MNYHQTLQFGLPHINFKEITPSDFFQKIKPFKDIFNNDTYFKFLEYYAFNNVSHPKFKMHIDYKIINSEQAFFQDRRSVRACRGRTIRAAILGGRVSEPRADEEQSRSSCVSQERCRDGDEDQGPALRPRVHHRRRAETARERGSGSA